MITIQTIFSPGVNRRRAVWFIENHVEEIEEILSVFGWASRLVIDEDEDGKFTAELQDRGGKTTVPVYCKEDFY